jgi:hypothetical protein
MSKNTATPSSVGKQNTPVEAFDSRTYCEREDCAERDGAEDAETPESQKCAKACPDTQGSNGEQCPRNV